MAFFLQKQVCAGCACSW